MSSPSSTWHIAHQHTHTAQHNKKKLTDAIYLNLKLKEVKKYTQRKDLNERQKTREQQQQKPETVLVSTNLHRI
jgi:hypothetical protein